MNPPTQNERFLATVNSWKSKLLDVSKRNRALNFKINKVSTVTIVDELPAEIFKLFRQKGKTLKFSRLMNLYLRVKVRHPILKIYLMKRKILTHRKMSKPNIRYFQFMNQKI